MCRWCRACRCRAVDHAVNTQIGRQSSGLTGSICAVCCWASAAHTHFSHEHKFIMSYAHLIQVEVQERSGGAASHPTRAFTAVFVTHTRIAVPYTGGASVGSDPTIGEPRASARARVGGPRVERSPDGRPCGSSKNCGACQHQLRGAMVAARTMAAPAAAGPPPTPAVPRAGGTASGNANIAAPAAAAAPPAAALAATGAAPTQAARLPQLQPA